MCRYLLPRVGSNSKLLCWCICESHATIRIMTDVQPLFPVWISCSEYLSLARVEDDECIFSLQQEDITCLSFLQVQLYSNPGTFIVRWPMPIYRSQLG